MGLGAVFGERFNHVLICMGNDYVPWTAVWVTVIVVWWEFRYGLCGRWAARGWAGLDSVSLCHLHQPAHCCGWKPGSCIPVLSNLFTH